MYMTQMENLRAWNAGVEKGNLWSATSVKVPGRLWDPLQLADAVFVSCRDDAGNAAAHLLHYCAHRAR